MRKNDMQSSLVISNETVGLASWNFYPLQISNDTWETVVAVEVSLGSRKQRERERERERESSATYAPVGPD